MCIYSIYHVCHVYTYICIYDVCVYIMTSVYIIQYVIHRYFMCMYRYIYKYIYLCTCVCTRAEFAMRKHQAIFHKKVLSLTTKGNHLRFRDLKR